MRVFVLLNLILTEAPGKAFDFFFFSFSPRHVYLESVAGAAQRR